MTGICVTVSVRFWDHANISQHGGGPCKPKFVHFARAATVRGRYRTSRILAELTTTRRHSGHETTEDENSSQGGYQNLTGQQRVEFVERFGGALGDTLAEEIIRASFVREDHSCTLALLEELSCYSRDSVAEICVVERTSPPRG
jgi:hypothetical protein